MHDTPFDLIALPEGIAGHYVEGLHASPAGFFVTEKEQVSADNRHEVCLIDAHVAAPPQHFAGLTVHGIERFFGPGDQNSHLGRLIEAQVIVEFGRPDWIAGIRLRTCGRKEE
jgi:hypothetical protein